MLAMFAFKRTVYNKIGFCLVFRLLIYDYYYCVVCNLHDLGMREAESAQSRQR